MKQENGAYTSDYKLGTWVTEPERPAAVGFLCDMDADDGEYLVVFLEPEDDGSFEMQTPWLDHETTLTPVDPPDFIKGATPEHVFVLLWLDEANNEQVSTFADPESALAHLPDALPAEAVSNMQVKLMEAVADPGEWQSVCESPYATLCFQPVVGAER